MPSETGEEPAKGGDQEIQHIDNSLVNCPVEMYLGNTISRYIEMDQ